MQVSEITRSLKEEPKSWSDQSECSTYWWFFRLNDACCFWVSRINLERSTVQGRPVGFLDDLRLRYAIWQWKNRKEIDQWCKQWEPGILPQIIMLIWGLIRWVWRWKRRHKNVR